jgi:hypothetical protein
VEGPVDEQEREGDTPGDTGSGFFGVVVEVETVACRPHYVARRGNAVTMMADVSDSVQGG